MEHDTLTAAQFEDFRQIIGTHLGIKMPPTKQVMLQGRLHRRLRELGLPSLEEYHRRFFEDPAQQAAELENLLNVVTTNKTDFFREAAHFEVLAREALPEWLRERRPGPFRVWCAGCASGEEPYTIAMTLLESRSQLDFAFQILATDVSTTVLETAMRAVYSEAHVAPIPAALRSKYLLRSRDRSDPKVRIAPAVRSCVRFGHLNFLAPDYGLTDSYDAIFFRNVMIYFDRETQRQVVAKMCRNLRVGGRLFISHSETLQGQPLPLELLSPAVYRRIPGEVAP